MNTNGYDNYCSFTLFLFYYIIPMFYYVRCMQVHVAFKGKLNDCSFGVTGMCVCLCCVGWVGVGVDMCICQCAEREWKLMFFVVGGTTGLKLQGAKCSNNVLDLTATILTELPLTTLEWVR